MLLRRHFRSFALTGFIALAEEMLRVIQPVFLSGLVQHFAFQSTVNTTQAYLYALGKPSRSFHGTVGQNNHEYRLEYWATHSSVRSHRSLVRLLHTARLVRSTALTRSLARSLHSLPLSWENQ